MPSLSYVHGVGRPLVADTIIGVFDRISHAHAGTEAVVSRAQGVSLTYGDLRAQVDTAARGLARLGLRRGDRLAVWSGSRVEWLIAQYAGARLGAVLVNLSPASSFDEILGALRQSHASILLAGDPGPSAQSSSRVAELARVIRVTDSAQPSPPERIVCFDGAVAGCLAWSDLLNGSPPATAMDLGAERQFDDPAAILYTSGTTGSPKGATMSHYALLNSAFFIGERLQYTNADRVCIPVPLNHTFGYVLGVLAVLTHGATIVLPSSVFDAGACLDAVEDCRCTSLYGVPAMFSAILGHRRFDRSRVVSLRTGIVAGAPCPEPLMHTLMTTLHMPEVAICYGMTEAGTICQTLPDDPPERRIGTAGAVHPHVECKIVDPPTGRVVPVGTPGELWARGYGLMSGYWNNEEATRAAIESSGWIRTGDLATMRDDRHVVIVGRLKEMVIAAGQNIHPQEIEEVLRTHPAVIDAAVIGVPDDVYGEAPCAYVQLRPGADARADDLRRFCRQRMARHKVPRYVRFVGELPRTATGKLQRLKLREHFVAETPQHADHRAVIPGSN